MEEFKNIMVKLLYIWIGANNIFHVSNFSLNLYVSVLLLAISGDSIYIMCTRVALLCAN
jgi:hypothetical protein